MHHIEEQNDAQSREMAPFSKLAMGNVGPTFHHNLPLILQVDHKKNHALLLPLSEDPEHLVGYWQNNSINAHNPFLKREK